MWRQKLSGVKLCNCFTFNPLKRGAIVRDPERNVPVRFGSSSISSPSPVAPPLSASWWRVSCPWAAPQRAFPDCLFLRRRSRRRGQETRPESESETGTEEKRRGELGAPPAASGSSPAPGPGLDPGLDPGLGLHREKRGEDWSLLNLLWDRESVTLWVKTSSSVSVSPVSLFPLRL